MALTIENLQVLITANAAQFKNELGGIKGELVKLGTTATATGARVQGGFFGDMLKANLATAVVTGGISLMTQAIAAIPRVIGQAITVSNQYTNALIGLDVVAGAKLGAKSIPKVREALNALTADGLAGIDDMSKSLQNLLASNFSLEESVNLLNAYKDAAAFNRQGQFKFGESILRTTEGIKNGNSVLSDSSGITKNLSTILKEAGKGADELANAASDASVRQTIYNGVLREAAIFQGNAALAARTSSGQLSQLGTTIKNLMSIMGNAIQPILKVVVGAIDLFFRGIGGSIQMATDSIQAGANRIAGFLLGLIRVIGTLGQYLPFVGGAFKNLANFSLEMGKGADKSAKALDGAGGSANKAGKSMDGAANKAKKLKKELLGLASFDEMNVLTTPADAAGAGGSGGGAGGGGIGGVGGGLGADAFKFDAGVGDINKFADEAFAFFKSIGDAISNFVTPALEALNSVWSWFNENVIEVFISKAPQLANAFGPIVDAIGKFLVGALQLAGDMAGWFWKEILQPFLSGFAASIKPALGLFLDLLTILGVQLAAVAVPILEGIMPALQSLWELFKLVWNQMKGHLTAVWENFIKPTLKQFFDFQNQYVIPVLKLIARVATDSFNYVKNTALSAWSFITTTLSRFVSWVNEVLLPVFTKMRDRFGSIMEGIKNSALNIWETVKGAFKTGINGLIDLMNGFIDKINEAINGFSQLAASVPGGQPITYRVGRIPRLAKGGVVDSPTVAMIGEAGKEAVVPLENNTSFLDQLADRLNESGGGNSEPRVIQIYIGSTKIADIVIDELNDRSLASGMPIFNV